MSKTKVAHDESRETRAAEEDAWRKKNAAKKVANDARSEWRDLDAAADAAEKAYEAAVAEEVEHRDLEAITANVEQAVRWGRLNVEKVGGGIYGEAEALDDLSFLIERVREQASTLSQIESLVTGQS
jgi:PBP1b-binding outer membrane lipoprotein LpoB